MTSLTMSDRNEMLRMILEMDKLKTELDAKLLDAGRYYDKLKDAYDAAINQLTVIEPKLDHSKRDADICHVAGNTTYVVGGILAGVSLTAGTPLALAAVGTGLIGVGGVVAAGAMVGNYVVKNMNYSEAKELLSKFERCRNQLFRELDCVNAVTTIINEKRNNNKYKVIFDIMFPENSVQFKVLNVYYQYPDFITKFDLLCRSDGVANVVRGVSLFVNILEDFSKQGAKLTKSAVTKILRSVAGFLFASIGDLAEGKKCEVAELIGLMKKTIQDDMKDIDDIRSKLYDFRLEETM